jgi:hypothetical protein
MIHAVRSIGVICWLVGSTFSIASPQDSVPSHVDIPVEGVVSIVSVASIGRNAIYLALLEGKKMMLLVRINPETKGIETLGIDSDDNSLHHFSSMAVVDGGVLVGISAPSPLPTTEQDPIVLNQGSARWAKERSVANSGRVEYWTFGNGRLNYRQTIRSPRGFAWDKFGSVMAVSGNKLFVGVSSGSTGGRIYRYRLENERWRLESTFESPSADFGASLTLSGDKILAGTSVRDDGAFDVYSFGPRGDVRPFKSLQSGSRTPGLADAAVRIFGSGSFLIAASAGLSMGDGGPPLAGIMEAYEMSSGKYVFRSMASDAADVSSVSSLIITGRQLAYVAREKIACRGAIPDSLALSPCERALTSGMSGEALWIGISGRKRVTVSRGSEGEPPRSILRVSWVEESDEQ